MYSKFLSIESFSGNDIAEFVIKYFDDGREENTQATARITLNREQFIKFHVDLLQVPVYQDTQGKDVMVNWEFPGMDMGKKLWFDANGLQMMKKQLNHRE